MVKYALGTLDYEWFFDYQSEPGELRVYGDSDWAADKETRRSVSSVTAHYGHHQLECLVAGQQLVALSSGEAEFYAAGKAAAHAIFYVALLKEFQRVRRGVVLSDSSAARGICGRTGPGWLRHIQVRFL